MTPVNGVNSLNWIFSPKVEVFRDFDFWKTKWFWEPSTFQLSLNPVVLFSSQEFNNCVVLALYLYQIWSLWNLFLWSSWDFREWTLSVWVLLYFSVFLCCPFKTVGFVLQTKGRLSLQFTSRQFNFESTPKHRVGWTKDVKKSSFFNPPLFQFIS